MSRTNPSSVHALFSRSHLWFLFLITPTFPPPLHARRQRLLASWSRWPNRSGAGRKAAVGGACAAIGATGVGQPARLEGWWLKAKSPVAAQAPSTEEGSAGSECATISRAPSSRHGVLRFSLTGAWVPLPCPNDMHALQLTEANAIRTISSGSFYQTRNKHYLTPSTKQQTGTVLS